MYHFNFLYWESAGDDLHFCLTENVFVSPSFLKGIFSGCRARLWLLFSFSSLILLPLAPGSRYCCWETSFSLIVVSLNVSILYFLAYFQIFSFSLEFCSFTMMYFGGDFCLLILPGIHWASGNVNWAFHRF